MTHPTRDLSVFPGEAEEPEKIAFDHFSEMPPLAELFDEPELPLEVEIGCGKGKFLRARAEESSGINFLGVDRVKKWMKRSIARVSRERVGNLKFVRAEIQAMLASYFPAGSVSVFHVYFPDPWPKRRHHKRRLLTGGFLRELHGRLRAGGLVEIATDHGDYYEKIMAAVKETQALWRSVRESQNRRLFDEALRTNYELKFESCGKTLYYLELVK